MDTVEELNGTYFLASDVSQTSYKTVRDYNKIARGNDKVW